MVTILRNDPYLIRIDQQKIKNGIVKALEYLNLSDNELTIAFESNKKLQELNNTYLGINETTDVLSFKSGDINPDSGRILLGDIIISLKKARLQAKEKKHSLDIEILTLCIHGILHLIDFDHATEMDKKKMFVMQKKLLGMVTN